MLIQEQELRKIFNLADVNKDKIVTVNELLYVLKNGQLKWSEVNRLKSALEKGDIDEDKKLSFEEFYRYYLKQKLRPVFNSADTDRDKLVTIDQILLVINQINSQEFYSVKKALEKQNYTENKKINFEEFLEYFLTKYLRTTNSI